MAIRTERTRRLRLAAEYVHAHAQEPITSADVALTSGLHPRSLQAQMSEHLGTSPTSYVRTVRLDRVRQDLLSGRPGETRVTEVARRWCFGNLGRFSAA